MNTSGRHAGWRTRKPLKIAIIRARLPGRAEIEVSGYGRGVRTAATRALLNLLRNRLLRRQRVANVQIELSVVSIAEVKPGGDSGGRHPEDA